MAYRYQTVNMVIDPVGEKAKRISLMRVLITPTAFQFPNILWPKLKYLSLPIKIHLFLPGSNHPLEAEGNPYEERSFVGKVYGMTLDISTEGRKQLESGWKEASNQKERRKLPRIYFFPAGSEPIRAYAFKEGGKEFEVELKDYTLNGLGLRVSSEMERSLELGDAVYVKIILTKSAGIRLVSADKKAASETESLILKTTVKRIVSVKWPESTLSPYSHVGVKIQKLDPVSASVWKKWIKNVVMKIQNEVGRTKTKKP